MDKHILNKLSRKHSINWILAITLKITQNITTKSTETVFLVLGDLWNFDFFNFIIILNKPTTVPTSELRTNFFPSVLEHIKF